MLALLDIHTNAQSQKKQKNKRAKKKKKKKNETNDKKSYVEMVTGSNPQLLNSYDKLVSIRLPSNLIIVFRYLNHNLKCTFHDETRRFDDILTINVSQVNLVRSVIRPDSTCPYQQFEALDELKTSLFVVQI